MKTNNLPDDAELVNRNQNFLFGSTPIEGNFLYPSAYFGLLLHLPTNK